jgi:V/A-type H+-transporting ATPase subunit I
MLRPERMQRVSLWLVRADAPAAALALAESGVFNADVGDRFRVELPDLGEHRYRETYLEARSRLDKLLELVPGMKSAADTAPPEPPGQPVPADELSALALRLGELWTLAFAADEAIHALAVDAARIEQQLDTLASFADLDLDLGRLAAEHRFLDVRLGTVPGPNVARLREALSLTGALLDSFAAGEGIEHCVMVGPGGHREEIDSLLGTAGWRKVELPAELLAHPRAARQQLEERRAALLAAQAERQATADAERAHWADELAAAERRLAAAAPYAETVGSALRVRGGLAMISGWVPTREVERLRTLLRARLANAFLLEARDPEAAERPAVPTLVRHPALLQSFAALVRTYGVPSYGEIDPTLFFAISFVLMFGMMFGDVGQGAVIVVAGLALRGRLRAARPLLVACGLAGMGFGLAYGSVFGNEHLFAPLWRSPLGDPLRVLGVAVGWGVGFLLVASLLRAWNLGQTRGWRAALGDRGGIAGIALYLGLVGAVAGALGHGPRPAFALLLAAAGALVALAHGYGEQSGSRGERFIVALMETAEAAIGYFANTLSFMRVGAFSLNHVALMLAVMAIARQLDGAGHLLALLAGNAAIIVIEGAIVAIQALRLEYYEGFSRYFGAGGRPFRPLAVGARVLR